MRPAADECSRKYAPCRERAMARRRCDRRGSSRRRRCASESISCGDTGKPQLVMVAAAAAGVVPTIPAGEFTAKKTPGCKRAGGDQRHDGDETFEQHGAVADRPGVPFARDHLGRGAGGDQRVETGYGAASDGDETEREDFAGEDGAGAIDESREGGKLQLRMHAR